MLNWRQPIARHNPIGEEAIVDVPWEALCDGHLYRLRRMLATMSAESVATGRCTEAEADRWLGSEELFQAFLESVRVPTLATIAELERWRSPTIDDVRALESLLADPQRMHFVKALGWQTKCVPASLLFSFTRGAVYTRDPSGIRDWLEVAVPIDPVAVHDALLWLLERGTPFEAGGAASAFYWFHAAVQDAGLKDPGNPSRRRAASLRRFVEVEDSIARRRLVQWIDWDKAVYPADLHPLLEQALAIKNTI